MSETRIEQGRFKCGTVDALVKCIEGEGTHKPESKRGRNETGPAGSENGTNSTSHFGTPHSLHALAHGDKALTYHVVLFLIAKAHSRPELT